MNQATKILSHHESFEELFKILNYFFENKYTRFSDVDTRLHESVTKCLEHGVKNHEIFDFASKIYKRGIISQNLSAVLNPTTYNIHAQAFTEPNIQFENQSQVESFLQNCDDSFFILIDNFFHFIDKKNNAFFIEAEEKNKNFFTIQKIIANIVEKKFCVSRIIGVGGGLTLDIAAFVASILQTKLTLIPTTLLAMIDATIGGKTGVNYEPYGKNQIGSFYFCDEIILAPYFLKSLPQEQVVSGMCEALKHSWLAGNFSKKKNVFEDMLNTHLEPKTLNTFILDSLMLKLSVVKKDPFEKTGVRAVLNFGHTIGHALESLITNTSQQIPHGIAVAHGMAFVLEYYYPKFSSETNDFKNFLNEILKLYPVHFEKYSKIEWKKFLQKDKKNISESKISLSLPSYGILKKKNFEEFYPTLVSLKEVLRNIHLHHRTRF